MADKEVEIVEKDATPNNVPRILTLYWPLSKVNFISALLLWLLWLWLWLWLFWWWWL